MSATASVATARYLRNKIGLTQDDLASATGATTRTVRRWTSDRSKPVRGPYYAQQIDNLNAIVSELQDSLTPKGIRQWLHARNRYLRGRRPIDLLREGQFEDVHEAAVAFCDGVYL